MNTLYPFGSPYLKIACHIPLIGDIFSPNCQDALARIMMTHYDAREKDACLAAYELLNEYRLIDRNRYLCSLALCIAAFVYIAFFSHPAFLVIAGGGALFVAFDAWEAANNWQQNKEHIAALQRRRGIWKKPREA